MRKLLSIFIFVMFANLITAQITKTIDVPTAGTLSSLLTSDEKSTITNLTVTGSIDARDIKCMRDEMTLLALMDISSVNINAYNGNSGTSTTITSYPANQMPCYSFYDEVFKVSKTSLQTIKLPTSLTSIGQYAFFYCSGLIGILSIPDSVTALGDRGFSHCYNITSLFLPENIGTIGNEAFATCRGLTGDLRIGDVVTYIGDGAFGSCGFKGTLILGKSIKTIRPFAFATTGFTGSLIIPNAVTYIGSQAFRGCSGFNGSLTIGNSLTSFDYGVFAESGFSSLTLGSSVTSIYNYVFNNCKNLKKIYCLIPKPPTLYFDTFGGVSADVFVPISTSSAYKNAAYWNTFNIIEYVLKASTQSINKIDSTSATLNGSLDVIAATPVSAYGFCWNTSGSPTITDNKVDNGPIVNLGDFSNTINNLVSGMTYFVRAYASDSERTVYGREISFTTIGLPVAAGEILGNTIICPNQDSVIYTVPPIAYATSYIWTLPIGATGTSSTNTIAVNYDNSAVSGNLTVKGHNIYGDGVVSTLPITVDQLPVITVADKTTICGGSVSLNATTNYSGSGTVNYQWSPVTGLNDATIANPTATVMNDINYTVTINTPNSCSTSRSLLVSIIPMEKPEIGMVGVSSDNKNFIAWNKPVSTGIESYYIYRETNIPNYYEKIGGVPYDSMSIFVDNQSLPDIQSYKYKLSIFDRHGFESPQSNSHKTLHLGISESVGNIWILRWDAYEGFTVSTYNIYRGTTPANLTFVTSISGDKNQFIDFYPPTGDVYYQLEVTSPNSVNPTKILNSQKINTEENGLSNSLISYSSSRSNIATNVISGIDELGENNKINIYPNPVKNELRIDFEEGSTFEILNLMGQVVYNGNLAKTTIVQTSILSSGIYLIKFNTGKTFEYKKIIKE